MARRVIYVVSNGDKWKVKCDHCGSEIKDTQAEAIKAAKKHVSELAEGTLSQIKVQGREAEWVNEWTYDKDPFPPAC